MSIRNAGKIIREARLKSGLTLEKLSENICFTQSLSRIEKGQAGVSHGTFTALMEKTGYHSSMLPEFESIEDFECVNHLNYASFHLHACKLQEAFDELQKVKSYQWNHNKFHYQKWLLLEAQLQMLCMNKDPMYLLSILEKSLFLTCPDIDYSSFQTKLLTTVEIELLLCIADTFLSIEKADLTLLICSQIQSYICNSNFTMEEKEILLAKHAIFYSHYLLFQGDSKSAYQYANTYRQKMFCHHQNTLLLLLTFQTATCLYQLGNSEEAMTMFRNAFYSAHAIQSHLATFFLHYVRDSLQVDFQIDESIFEEITIQIPTFTITDVEDLNDGIYHATHPYLTFGQLIQELRSRNKISQQQLCDGLCTKSKLSKIENGTLQPDTILAETLLQRLGISEREFIFFGSSSEEKYHALKNQSIINMHIQDNEQEQVSHLIQDTSFVQNPMYQQIALLSQFHLVDSEDQVLKCLYDSLSCTVPSFDTSYFTTHLFSWAELSILNNIAYFKGCNSSPFEAISLFQKLLEYRKQHSHSIIFDVQIYSITFRHFARFLSTHSYDTELFQFFQNEDHTLTHYDFSILAGFYYYVSQSVYMCSSDASNVKYIYYTFALKNIVGDFQNATHFRDDFKSFSHIDINY